MKNELEENYNKMMIAGNTLKKFSNLFREFEIADGDFKLHLSVGDYGIAQETVYAKIELNNGDTIKFNARNIPDLIELLKEAYNVGEIRNLEELEKEIKSRQVEKKL